MFLPRTTFVWIWLDFEDPQRGLLFCFLVSNEKNLFYSQVFTQYGRLLVKKLPWMPLSHGLSHDDLAF